MKLKKLGIGCLGLIAVIILIAVIAGIAGGGGDETASEEEIQETQEEAEEGGEAEPSEETNEAVEAEEAEETATLGDTIDVGNIQYTINDVNTTTEVGPSALPTTTSEQFIVLDITVMNNGDEAITFDSSYIKLQEGDRTFEPSPDASMSANQGEDGNIENSFFLEEINPGSEVTGSVVFDVAPSVAEAEGLQAQVQEGMFGSNTAIIDLD